MPSSAWWGKEHEIIAKIAENNLTQEAAKKINILLEGDSLSGVANWADRIKSQSKWSHSRRWHYVNIKKGESIANYKVSVGGDILWALDYFYWQIGDKSKSVSQRREALMFFVHLVADIHQPLHVGFSGDAGGNKKPVMWKSQNRLVNLHKVWDGLLTSPNLTSDQYAKKINKQLTKDRHLWMKSSFKDWAVESLKLQKFVYDFGRQNSPKKPLHLGAEYQNRNLPVAEKRMLQAGVRLAHFLNQAFE
jgi:hypothetical protein